MSCYKFRKEYTLFFKLKKSHKSYNITTLIFLQFDFNIKIYFCYFLIIGWKRRKRGQILAIKKEKCRLHQFLEKLILSNFVIFSVFIFINLDFLSYFLIFFGFGWEWNIWYKLKKQHWDLFIYIMCYNYLYKWMKHENYRRRLSQTKAIVTN